MLLGSAREGCASLLRPGLWILMVVCGGWMLLGVSGDGVCVVRADSDDGWSFSGDGSGCLLLVFVHSFFSQFISCNRLILYELYL